MATPPLCAVHARNFLFLVNQLRSCSKQKSHRTALQQLHLLTCTMLGKIKAAKRRGVETMMQKAGKSKGAGDGTCSCRGSAHGNTCVPSAEAERTEQGWKERVSSTMLVCSRRVAKCGAPACMCSVQAVRNAGLVPRSVGKRGRLDRSDDNEHWPRFHPSPVSLFSSLPLGSPHSASHTPPPPPRPAAPRAAPL